MQAVTFRHYKPKAPLSQFVGVFWYWQGYDLQAGKERCLPSGTTELVISLRNPKPSGAVICGARSTAFILERTQQDCLLGIHFNAGGAFPFLGVPASELQNAELTLDDMWPGESNRLRSRLMEAPTIDAKFRIIESWLLTKLKVPMVHHPARQYALNRLGAGPNSKTAEMADEVSLVPENKLRRPYESKTSS